MPSLAGIRALRREAGTRVALLYVLHRLLQAASRGRAGVVSYTLLAQPIQPAAPSPPLRPDAASEVREVRPGDPLAEHFPRPAAVNARRWAAGARCHAITVKGRFAGTIWIQRDAYDEDEVRCTFVLDSPAESCWDFDVYIEPTFRLGRSMARLWQAVSGELACQGVRWTFSRISDFNRDSLRSHARLGARPVCDATFLVLGSWQVAWLDGHWSVTGPGSPPPRLRLRPPA
jgi:hypothetical protein